MFKNLYKKIVDRPQSFYYNTLTTRIIQVDKILHLLNAIEDCDNNLSINKNCSI